MSDSDDALVGRLWTRREVFRVFGAAGLAAMAGCSGSSGGGAATTTSSGGSTSTSSGGSTTSSAGALNVVATPALTEGPFFVDEGLQRADLLAGSSRASVQDGAPLTLALGVYSLTANGPVPIEGAQVDVWHADALGTYSDVAAGSVQSEDTRGQTWLRGYQLTDRDGQASFATIYPGWYVGRTIHVHFKIRIGSPARTLTSQLFFDDAVSDAVMNAYPYAGRGVRSVRNTNDGIYQALHTDGAAVGSHLHLALASVGTAYTGTFNVGLA